MPFPLEQWYMEIPIVTRIYLTLVALTSFVCVIIIKFHSSILKFIYNELINVLLIFLN